MVKKYISIVLLGVLLSALTACRTHGILRSAGQDEKFQQRYVGKPYYTAMVLRPYDDGKTYLIDLTGEFAETAFEMPRIPEEVPLGTPVTITGIDDRFVLTRIEGYARPFRVIVSTERGTVDDLERELSLFISDTPPLQSARPLMQPFIRQQKVARGMSRREVYMSWGQPDRVNSSPGSSGYLEKWSYFGRRTHVFLRNGFVTNWQLF
jgi:hypothetical protein